jgi:hypothetical protein
MRPSIALKRLAAVAAALGIALQGLWPLLAQARARSAGSVTICSSEGAHRAAELPLDGERSKQCAEHCRLFVTGSDKPVLAGNQGGFALLNDGKTEEFFRQGSFCANPAFAASFRPRAPPHLSLK